MPIESISEFRPRKTPRPSRSFSCSNLEQQHPGHRLAPLRVFRERFSRRKNQKIGRSDARFGLQAFPAYQTMTSESKI